MSPTKLPTLETERLLLRPFETTDAARIALLAGDREIAATTLRIPHPYKEEDAVKFIEAVGKEILKGKSAVFAIILKETGELIGSIGLHIDKDHENAEMGYWVGKPYWGKGYCTESASKILEYGFNNRNLHKIHAHFMECNPASGRVMEKIGMFCEGTLREHVKKWGEFMNMICYSILIQEFRGQNGNSS
ncbi:MAG: GNAT family N-acetyltransferase [Candidatus Omnitrophica bacterium]|nr:GNAT family N-acetyltransferase [Candidatus Omnitrophota bacterium]MCB9784064.1 GNAT family N-acetyltransferase [Candidatus Omnitrophota bacterium]